MANSTLAIINSRNRLPESISSSNFSYNIGSAIEIQELALKSVSLPNTAYNINPNNDKINFIYNGITYTRAIASGQYNITTLSAAIKAAVASATGNPTALTSIIENPITGKLKYTWDQPTQIYVIGVWVLMGFNIQLNTFYPAVAANVIDSPTLPNLQGSMNYYLASRTLAQGTNALNWSSYVVFNCDCN